jgi:hypothetical protein
MHDDEDTFQDEGRVYREHDVDHYGKPIGHPFEPEFVPKYKRRLDPAHLRADDKDIDKKVEDHASELEAKSKQSMHAHRKDEK